MKTLKTWQEVGGNLKGNRRRDNRFILEKNNNYIMISYAAVNIVAIVLTIAMDMVHKAYKQFAFPPMLAYALYIAIPIVVSILFFFKIIIQNKIPVWFSRLVNIIVLVLFVVAVNVFYHPLGLVSFISTYNLAAFIFSLQLCSFVYDVFFRKSVS